MTYPPPYSDDPGGLNAAARPEPTPVERVKLQSPVKIAGFIALLLFLSFLAVVIFIALTIGVTILVGEVAPRPVNVIAPIVGVGVAVLCFGGASRIRRGMFRNRYGLMRRPHRDPKPDQPAG